MPFTLAQSAPLGRMGAVRIRRVHVAVAGAALVCPLGVNAALQAQGTSAPGPGAANVSGYGVLSQSGGAASAIANVAGVGSRTARASGAGDARGTVDGVTVVVRARRSARGSDVVGLVRAGGISLFAGRVRIVSLETRVRGHADAAAADGAVDLVRVEGVTVDGQPVEVQAGQVVEVPGAGLFGVAESARDASGATQVNALRVEADDSPGLAPLVVGHFTLNTAPGPVTVAPDPPAAPAAASPPDPGAAPSAPGAVPPGSTPPASDEPGRPDGADVTSPPIVVQPLPSPSGPPAASSPVLPAPSSAPRVLPSPHLLPGTPADSVPKQQAPQSVTGVRGSVFPVQGAFTFTSDYGAPRAGTGWHHGNDVFAPVGTPIVAVADGILSKVGWNTLGGNRLWLTDAGGTSYYYAHLSAYSSASVDGAVVRAGDVIGYVGNTGQASTTPPHLHFEIHPGGVDAASVNPYPFLTAWQAHPVTLGVTTTTLAPVSLDAGAGAVVVGVELDRPGPPAVGDGMARPAR